LDGTRLKEENSDDRVKGGSKLEGIRMCGHISMKAINKIFAVIMVVWLVGGSSLASQETGQNIDPFYLQRLESGERAFLAGDIESAVKDLEIALFGLRGDKALKAKAFLYLGLSQYSLKNSKKAEEYLRNAKNILGMDGLRPLISSEAVWLYLNKIMVELKILEAKPESRGGAAVKMANLGQRRTGDADAGNLVEELEQRIRSNPRDTALYYELYEYHEKNGDTDEAKKILENLVKRNPDEAKGYYLLGRIHYKQRDLKVAEKNLNQVFELEKKVPVEDYVLAEAMAYQILTFHLEGNREASSRMFAKWADYFSEDKIRFLGLDKQDRSIFMGIAHNDTTIETIKKMRNKAGSVSEEGKGLEDEQTQSLPSQSGSEIAENSAELQAGGLVPLDQVDTPPVLKKRVDPKYPASAKALGIEGQVTVNVLISETGDVVEVTVLHGLAGGFDEATVTAVKQWKYDPAVKDALKVRVWKPITITFKKR
jgi:TonB family protein